MEGCCTLVSVGGRVPVEITLKVGREWLGKEDTKEDDEYISTLGMDRKGGVGKKIKSCKKKVEKKNRKQTNTTTINKGCLPLSYLHYNTQINIVVIFVSELMKI